MFNFALLAILPAVLPAQAVDIRMESSIQTVRMGESFSLDVYVDNPALLDLAGYQVGFAWSTDKLEMTSAPTSLPSSVLDDLFSFNAPPFSNGSSNCPSFGDGQGRDGANVLSISLSPGSPFATGHLFRCFFRAK